MKLSEWAKKNSITYRTAWNHFKAGKIPGAYKIESGTIVVPESSEKDEKTIIYARVSSSQNRKNLKKQADRLVSYCMANGWKIDERVEEVGSGMNDKRRKLLKILEKGKATRLVVEHKDRLSRFGVEYIRVLCEHIGCELVIVNNAEDDKSDLMQDFVSIVTSFCSKIYGQRRGKRKTEKMIEELNR
jgi:putative resolvase